MSVIIDKHLQGIPRLLHPQESQRAKQAFKSDKGREKFLARLRHNIEMHPDFTTRPKRGQRDMVSIYQELKRLGATDICYVMASDSDFQGVAHEYEHTMQPLRLMLEEAADVFGHGTIISCIPGKLALFRTADRPHHLITHSP